MASAFNQPHCLRAATSDERAKLHDIVFFKGGFATTETNAHEKD
jgi:hypothetical protein